MVNHQGFTLVEIMIVVVIVGILAAIAYPSYTQYVIKSNRVDAQTEMVRVSSVLQRYKILNSTYLKENQALTLSDLDVSEAYPNAAKELYTLSLSDVTAGTWTLTANPQGMQAGNGSLILNSLGQKCWTEGSSCTPTATSNWERK